MIESPPKITKENFDKALRLSVDREIAALVDGINREYSYWTEIKYRSLPGKISPQDLWACVKLSRMFAKTLEIGAYRFKLYVTDGMQRLCHEFDMNLGGYLGTQSFIPEADKNRYLVSSNMEEAIASENTPADYKEAFQAWIDNQNDANKTKELADKIIPMVEAAKDKCPACATIDSLKSFLVKRSQWIIGGDGASYDIGYGGLDHVIASGKNVNILVLDTEVYSNTGGQSSKATPLGAIAKFAASGKRVRKKDLGLMATTYGYVYVAQIAMGADQAQTLKALREAEAYDGPSLIIAYAPCINHGLKKGMGKSQAEEKAAVECGYWHLWRYNPALEAEGKNPFTLDSKEPDWSKFQDYLKGEVRFASVMKQYPGEAAELFKAAEDNAKWRLKSYKRLAAENWSIEE